MHRLLILAALASFATPAFPKDVVLTVGGSVGAFRTDARVFNPSATKDITIQAYYLPIGNVDNSGVQPISFTVPHRQMLVYDDVVSSLFHLDGLGAIRLQSDDDFVATQRIYAQQPATSCAAAGTLGQFLAGNDVTSASTAGVLIQLKSSSSFRTNLGAVNPGSSTAHVTFRLYDKNNALVATGSPITMPAYGVIGPTNMTSGFFFNATGVDMSDAWVNFTADQPVIAYASVVDQSTTDPTYIAMMPDSGAASTTNPTDSGKTFDVTLMTAAISIAPAIASNTLKVGDKVTFHVANTTTDNAIHGFTLISPTGAVLVPSRFYTAGSAAVDQTFTIPSQGTYTYYCTNTTCSTGHTNMVGSFNVGQPTETDPGGKY
jgi:plastocyanin